MGRVDGGAEGAPVVRRSDTTHLLESLEPLGTQHFLLGFFFPVQQSMLIGAKNEKKSGLPGDT